MKSKYFCIIFVYYQCRFFLVYHKHLSVALVSELFTVFLPQ